MAKKKTTRKPAKKKAAKKKTTRKPAVKKKTTRKKPAKTREVVVTLTTSEPDETTLSLIPDDATRVLVLDTDLKERWRVPDQIKTEDRIVMDAGVPRTMSGQVGRKPRVKKPEPRQPRIVYAIPTQAEIIIDAERVAPREAHRDWINGYIAAATHYERKIAALRRTAPVAVASAGRKPGKRTRIDYEILGSQLLDHLRKSGPTATTGDLSAIFNCSPVQARRALAPALEAGQVRQAGMGRATHWVLVE